VRVVAAGVLALFAGGQGVAAGETGGRPSSLLYSVVGADVGTLVGGPAAIVCGPLLRGDGNRTECVNGSVGSGNSLHSGNFSNHGNANGSGNPVSMNGSPHTGNSVSGDTVDSGNTVQRVRRPPSG
jgi:hypothetical protein